MPDIKYENHPLLPADAPKGQFHILKEDPYTGESKNLMFPMGHNPGLGDHIATVLLHLEGQGHPDALKDFFNPNIKSFKLLRVEEQGACYMSCIIWRVKNEVMAGFYNVSMNGKFLQWEILSRSNLSKIASDAAWTVKWGAYSAISRFPMADMWKPNGLRQVNYPFFLENDPKDPGEAARVAYNFGYAVCARKVWKDSEDAKCIVEVQ